MSLLPGPKKRRRASRLALLTDSGVSWYSTGSIDDAYGVESVHLKE